MKKLLFSFITMLAFSCSVDNVQPPPPTEKLKFLSVTNEMRQLVFRTMAKHNNARMAAAWDYDNMQAMQVSQGYYTVVINDLSAPYGTKRVLGLNYNSENVNFGNLIAKSSTVNGRKRIEFFDDDGIRIDGFDMYTNLGTAKRVGQPQPRDCGQGTMDCLGEFYTKYGYFSLTMTLLAVFEPYTAVAAAAGCYIECVTR